VPAIAKHLCVTLNAGDLIERGLRRQPRLDQVQQIDQPRAALATQHTGVVATTPRTLVRVAEQLSVHDSRRGVLPARSGTAPAVVHAAHEATRVALGELPVVHELDR
jgi:hypothetical protein